MISVLIAMVAILAIILPLVGMAKLKSIASIQQTVHNAYYTFSQDVPLIGDVQGFDVWIEDTLTFGSGSSNVRDRIDYIKIITDDSENLHEIKNFQNDSLTNLLAMMNRINKPTDEAHATTVACNVHLFLPCPIIRTMTANATIEIGFKAGTTVNAVASADTLNVNVSAKYGPVSELTRISTLIKSEIGPNYDIQLPADKGNITGFFLASTDADLVNRNTIINLLDEKGLPLVDQMRASEIVVENEGNLGYGWKGARNAVYMLYIDTALIACKSDIRLKIEGNGTLTNGLCIYWLTSYATQGLTRPDQITAKQMEIGSYDASQVEIVKFHRYEDQLARVKAPLLALPAKAGTKMTSGEKSA